MDRKTKLEKRRSYYIRNRAKMRLYYRKKCQADPQFSRFMHIRSRYGITREQYEALIKEQQWRCYICKIHENESSKRRLCIDHDHETGLARKLLCGNCNRMLSNAKENIRILELGIDYLRQHGK